MHTKLLVGSLAAGTLLLSGCEMSDNNDNDTDDSSDNASANLRVLHASGDAPAVNVYLDNALTPAIDTLDFGEASAWAEVDAQTYDVDVFGILPDLSDTADAVISADLDLMDDMNYTVVAVNELASISAKVFADDGTTTDSSKVRVQVAHLTSGAPAVDVHVTAPTDALSANTVLGTVSFSDTDTLGPVLVDADTYRIRITAQNDASTVLYDSGEVSLAAGSDLFIGAIPNESGIGDSPVTLAVLDGTDTTLLYDQDDGAAVRAVHNVSDVGEVDIFAAGDTTANLDVTDFSNGNATFADVTYEAVSNYAEVAAGDFDLAVSTDNSSAAISAEGVSVASGMSYSVFAMGTASGADSAELELVPYIDDRRDIATGAKVRIIHGAADTADVDVYVTAGTDITNEDPAFVDVSYKADTGFVQLAAGTYYATVTPADSKTIAIQAQLTVAAGDIITVWAQDGGDVVVRDDTP
ncbi:DUF4397 domain-containing protein [Saccharospirillum salsuginis]|uniref:DUF4397 domain-containing protein n=1 Tax=Saccharospirillum salsuginis TaxID=418750 RepID=A0A918KLK4_9GAMM|nr:DUF4397 domain-containing protein [Saccharospirillum salsuginis]GGX68306.1 hypothetical protein GCM10007392_39840 [Saccharospirillum salsuginis]